MTSKEEFSRMAELWDNEALIAAVEAFLSDSSNTISQEHVGVEELSRDDAARHIRFYINVEHPNTLEYGREVARKLPGFKYQHAKVKIIDGSSEYAELRFRTWLEFTPISNSIISVQQLILLLLSILLFAWAFYSLWYHWLNYDKPWKNLVSRFLEEYLTGLMYGAIGGNGRIPPATNNL